MGKGRRTRHELRDGQAAAVARKTREDALRLIGAWGSFEAAQAALEAVQQCDAVWPPTTRDVAPTVCDRLAGHPAGEDDQGHRYRFPGTRVVVTW